MAVTNNWYGPAFQSVFNKEADFIGADSIKCLMTTNTYVPNQNTHQYKDVSITNELPATGNYTTGGQAITPCTHSVATLVYSLDGADAAWTTLTATGARYGIVYDDTPVSSKPLLNYVNFGADQSPAGVNFTIQWAAAGIVQVTVS